VTAVFDAASVGELAVLVDQARDAAPAPEGEQPG